MQFPPCVANYQTIDLYVSYTFWIKIYLIIVQKILERLNATKFVIYDFTSSLYSNYQNSLLNFKVIFAKPNLLLVRFSISCNMLIIFHWEYASPFVHDALYFYSFALINSSARMKLLLLKTNRIKNVQVNNNETHKSYTSLSKQFVQYPSNHPIILVQIVSLMITLYN